MDDVELATLARELRDDSRVAAGYMNCEPFDADQIVPQLDRLTREFVRGVASMHELTPPKD